MDDQTSAKAIKQNINCRVKVVGTHFKMCQPSHVFEMFTTRYCGGECEIRNWRQ